MNLQVMLLIIHSFIYVFIYVIIIINFFNFLLFEIFWKIIDIEVFQKCDKIAIRYVSQIC